MLTPGTGSQGAVDILGPYESTEVLGEYEVRINYSRPFPNAAESLSETELSPVSPSAVEELGNGGFAQAPVGTGPFRFVQWDQGSQVVLERNPDYAWAPEFYDNDGPSQVARIVHRFIPNAGTRVAALEADEVDITDLTPPLDMRRLGDSDEFETMTGVASGVPLSVMFNVSRGPLQDINVRKAFFHAVDRQRLSENLFFGFADAAYGPISSSTPGYWEGAEDYYPYDPDEAARLLEESGWTMGSDGIREKDGEKLQIFYPTLLEPETSVALQAELKKVGIDLLVENVTKARQDELILANEYDMGGIRWVYNSPTVLAIPFTSGNIPEPGVFKFNWMRWDNPEFDAKLEDGGDGDLGGRDDAGLRRRAEDDHGRRDLHGDPRSGADHRLRQRHHRAALRPRQLAGPALRRAARRRMTSACGGSSGAARVRRRPCATPSAASSGSSRFCSSPGRSSSRCCRSSPAIR